MKRSKSTPTLETARLRLRRFTAADADAMYGGWASDADVARFMRWAPHANVAETANLIQIWIKSYDADDFHLWAIERSEDGALIGSIGLTPVNAHDQCFDVAYNLAKSAWNRGYGAEALQAVIDFGFSTGRINRIEAYHAVDNPASGCIMRKCGLRSEGHSRQKYKSNRGYEDCDLYALLKSDWDADRSTYNAADPKSSPTH